MKSQKQKGFSLIELVIVIIILGILAATALPRFLDVTDEAKVASLEGVAGGFATAVTLVRSQWEAEGRPQTSEKNTVQYDTDTIYLGTPTTANAYSPGYPVSVSTQNADALSISAAQCLEVWDSIFQSPSPATTSSDAAVIAKAKYVVRANAQTAPQCIFYQVVGLDKDGSGAYVPPAANDTSKYHNFTYTPSTGRVLTNIID
ncbi:prepilin-type N-terminal cleavage/methylation domain-containing protein [Alginatibacterium sediminis]|uniref:Prepilin-type N-terminal cleavage/methylation domain-containing protein n=1 Tax=Alginatibacterium sediminis TaxID=2164068 RepID=A0A420EL16_9ALTE|nr:prepilin-type N-terminal cleavage/methylation domain-containing protein [Alginatibacterium sediminis]RKF21373.1 prepilin-type N-terminal cleavage/methylation domain-containing protein [Alginatibacterium sediminis]